MFKSITYLKFDCDTGSDIYKVIDTNFECELIVGPQAFSVVASFFIFLAQEYEIRNYSYHDIVKDLFRCNLYLCNKFSYLFEYLLSLQNEFTHKYYESVKDMWDKHKAFT